MTTKIPEPSVRSNPHLNAAGISAVLRFADVRNNRRKMVLVALAGRADAQGVVAMPVHEIQRVFGISERCVQMCLRDLESTGWLETEQMQTTQGASAASRYRMPFLPGAIARLPVGWEAGAQ